MKKTLIYIIGAGRSGTTLLDILLGNQESSISLGEINRFFKRNGYPPKRSSESKVYDFWYKFRNQIIERGCADFKKLHYLSKQNEYHTTFLKGALKRNNKMYVEALKLQYELLFLNTTEGVLIESSKYPVRAINISNYIDKDKYQIKYIFLKKDPVKVVKSFEKKELEQPSKGYFSANIYYLIVNILCIISTWYLKMKGHKVSSILYEELTKNPEIVFNTIGEDLQMNFSELTNKISKGEQLNTGYLFDGNRIRLKETLTLRISDGIDRMSFRDYVTRAINFLVYR